VHDSWLAGNISALQLVAGAAWLTVAVAAAFALHRAQAGTAVVAATGISIVFAAHVAPAAIGLLALTVAGVLRERQRTQPSSGGRAMTSPPAARAGGTHGEAPATSGV
jgi:hypothetical protein